MGGKFEVPAARKTSVMVYLLGLYAWGASWKTGDKWSSVACSAAAVPVAVREGARRNAAGTRS